jgi:aminopeptidase N
LRKHATDEAELTRFFGALAGVRDPTLAQQVAQIALSKEIPPQDVMLRMAMITGLRIEHPQLAWETFADQQQMLLAPQGNLAPLILAQYVPRFFWNSQPLDQLESWLKAHVPPAMTDNIAKGMQSARFKVTEKEALVPAADSYLAARAAHARLRLAEPSLLGSSPAAPVPVVLHTVIRGEVSSVR